MPIKTLLVGAIALSTFWADFAQADALWCRDTGYGWKCMDQWGKDRPDRFDTHIGRDLLVAMPFEAKQYPQRINDIIALRDQGVCEQTYVDTDTVNRYTRTVKINACTRQLLDRTLDFH